MTAENRTAPERRNTRQTYEKGVRPYVRGKFYIHPPRHASPAGWARSVYKCRPVEGADTAEAFDALPLDGTAGADLLDAYDKYLGGESGRLTSIYYSPDDFSELDDPPPDDACKPHDEPPPNLGAEAKGALTRGQKPPKFPLIAWQDIAFDAEEEWRVEGVFPRIGLACLYGGSGAVKTFILLDLFNRMACGGLWGERDVEQSPVVYIAAEGANGIKKRIAALKKIRAEKGLPANVAFYLITVAPNLGTGEGDLKELIRCIEAIGIRPGAIAIDTTAQSIGGADENTTGMAQLVANATALVNYFACLVALVHHVPLADEERLRGGTALIGALDVSILSKRQKGSLIATLTIKKTKDDNDEQTFTVHLARIVLGHTRKGRDVSTLVVESVEEGAAEGGKISKRRGEVDVVTDEFLKAYDRIADDVAQLPGLDFNLVRKVSADAIRAELKSRGFLETGDNDALTATGRSHFRRAKLDLLNDGKLIEKGGLIWRP